MYNIARYQKLSDEYTTYRLQYNAGEDEAGPIELCEIDGWTYVAIPDGLVLPEQTVTVEYIEPDIAIGVRIIEQSRFVRHQMAAMGAYWALRYLGMTASAMEYIIYGVLSVDTTTIPPDGTTEATINYTANEDVKFIVDGEAVIKSPVLGVATLTVAADAAGIVEVRVPGVEKVVTITVEAV